MGSPSARLWRAVCREKRPSRKWAAGRWPHRSDQEPVQQDQDQILNKTDPFRYKFRQTAYVTLLCVDADIREVMKTPRLRDVLPAPSRESVYLRVTECERSF